MSGMTQAVREGDSRSSPGPGPRLLMLGYHEVLTVLVPL